MARRSTSSKDVVRADPPTKSPLFLGVFLESLSVDNKLLGKGNGKLTLAVDRNFDLERTPPRKEGGPSQASVSVQLVVSGTIEGQTKPSLTIKARFQGKFAFRKGVTDAMANKLCLNDEYRFSMNMQVLAVAMTHVKALLELSSVTARGIHLGV
jgi:hypothetical protein